MSGEKLRAVLGVNGDEAPAEQKSTVMEPLPDDHGYRWHGQLNGGAVLEGTEKYLGCRGSGPLIEHKCLPKYPPLLSRAHSDDGLNDRAVVYPSAAVHDAPRRTP